MDFTTILLLIMVLSELSLGIYIWNQLRNLYVSRYRGYDFLFIIWTVMLVIARAASLLELKYVQGGVFSVVDVFRFTDLNFEYLVFPYIPLLVFGIWSTQIEIRKDWKKHAVSMLYYGILMTIPITIAQIARGLVLGWELNNLAYHVIQALVLVLLAVVFYRSINQKGRIVLTPLMAVGLIFATVSVTFWIPGFLSPDESIAKLATQVVMAALLVLPLIVYRDQAPRRQETPTNVRFRR